MGINSAKEEENSPLGGGLEESWMDIISAQRVTMEADTNKLEVWSKIKPVNRLKEEFRTRLQTLGKPSASAPHS